MATVSSPEPGVLALEGEIDLHESPAVREKLKLIAAYKCVKPVLMRGGGYPGPTGRSW